MNPVPPTIPPARSVALVPSGLVLDSGFERAVADLRAAGWPVWRVRQPAPPPDAREGLVADAIKKGCDEILLLDPAVVFDPADVARLRSHRLPFRRRYLVTTPLEVGIASRGSGL